MSLGRGGFLGKGDWNAGDVTKETIIKGATGSLRICRQDLLFLGMMMKAGNTVRQWIIQALIASDKP